MQTLQFSIEIHAPKDEVWNILWDDKTFRDWSNIIDEGTYMVGEMKEGVEVQFISGSSGYGVTSYIEKLTPQEFVLFKHMQDTQNNGAAEREKEWSGAQERYTLFQEGDTTTLTVNLDAPPEQVKTFQERVPKALQRIKELSEE